MRLRNHIVGAFVVFATCAFSLGQDEKPAPAHARVKLVSDTSTIVAGQPFTVAMVFDIDKDWHLYWKDPGDSGMPPKVKWTLPEGFAAGELQFPKPEILKTPAGVNYVHEKELALLVTITPPKELKPGQTISLKADLKWLECTTEVCLPAKQSAQLDVTTGTEAKPADETRFVEWRAAVKAGEQFDPAKTD